MPTSFDRLLDAGFSGKSVQQILDSSPAILKGISAADAQKLDSAFGIKTVRDLAQSSFFQRARAVLAASGTPGFDPGPPADWESFFASAPLGHYEQHASGRFRLAFGPVYYRGRLDGSARVIVVGQDPSTDEILGHRILVGTSGQRVQGLLRKLGVTRSYAMVNTFLYSVFGQFDDGLRGISMEPPILNFRNEFLDRLAATSPIQAIVAFGLGAQHAVQNWPGSAAFPVFQLLHPSAPTAAVISSWNGKLAALQAAITPDDDGQVDPAAYGNGFQPHDQPSIPSFDLPFGLPKWHGTGDRSQRDGNQKIVWTAP